MKSEEMGKGMRETGKGAAIQECTAFIKPITVSICIHKLHVLDRMSNRSNFKEYELSASQF